jgi:hypothetical protein
LQIVSLYAYLPQWILLFFMDDFSTNRHSLLGIKFEFEPCRHPDIWFSDGNIALVAGDFYFTVHQGVLCRHSELLAELIKKLKVEDSQPRLIEGHFVLVLNDQPKDLARFLLALYDGVYVPAILLGISFCSYE